MGELAGWVGVGVLAMAGALARYTVGTAVQRRARSPFPVGTLAINTSGSLALGILAGAGLAGWPLRLAGAALLGSYTTFSTWIVDSGELLERGTRREAALNVVGSLALGLAAVALGWALGTAL
jgi:fluoride exporter